MQTRIECVLLAVAQSQSLPGAPVSLDESHDESTEESRERKKREKRKEKEKEKECNLKGALHPFQLSRHFGISKNLKNKGDN